MTITRSNPLITIYTWDRDSPLDRLNQVLSEGLSRHIIWHPHWSPEDLTEIESGLRVAQQSDSELSIQLKCWAAGH